MEQRDLLRNWYELHLAGDHRRHSVVAINSSHLVGHLNWYRSLKWSFGILIITASARVVYGGIDLIVY